MNMQKSFLIIFLIVILKQKCDCFLHLSNRFRSKLFAKRQERWYNPDFDEIQIDKWFNSIDKSLLTIGKLGVQDSHLNSINELLKSHELVRVKVASDKMNITEIANTCILSSQLSSSKLLAIRQTEFLIGEMKNWI